MPCPDHGFHRTRGIIGYTGAQPVPGKSKEPEKSEDPSKTYGINAFDGRKPWVKGIPGYTGHQPPQTADNQRLQGSERNGELATELKNRCSEV